MSETEVVYSRCSRWVDLCSEDELEAWIKDQATRRSLDSLKSIARAIWNINGDINGRSL